MEIDFKDLLMTRVLDVEMIAISEYIDANQTFLFHCL